MHRTCVRLQKVCNKSTHVIFDLDGLLLDTERVYKHVISDIAARYGKVYTPEIRIKVLGSKDTVTSNIVVREMKLPINDKHFLEIFRKETHRLMGNCPLMPGAERIVRHLKANCVPFAIATSSTYSSFLNKTQNHRDFFKLFHHVVAGGSDPEVKESKPSPYIFLVCARRFPDTPKPECCLVFEDAPNGVTGAISAGMQCVMVPEKGIDPTLCEDATVVLNSLEETKLESFSLPPLKS